MFRAFENYQKNVVFFHSNFCQFELAKKCNIARSNFLIALTNEEIFSKRLTTQLRPAAAGIPYHISAEEPEQVIVFKKIINSLYNIEKIFSEIEALNVDTHVPGHLYNATSLVKNLYHAVNQAYELIQLVNTGGTAIQSVFAPQLENMRVGFELLSEQLQQFSTSHGSNLEDTLGEKAAQAISFLPTERMTSDDVKFDSLTKFILDIPGYLHQLQAIIQTESLFPEGVNPATSKREQPRLERNAKNLAKHLEKLTAKSGFAQNYRLLKVLKKLGNYATDFINTGAPATKAAYEKSVEKLIQFKTELLPVVIAELESLEENLGLMPGSLTEPTLKSAESYYETMAQSLEKLGKFTEKIDNAESLLNKWYVKAGRAILLSDDREVNLGPAVQKKEDIEHIVHENFLEQRKRLQIGRANRSQLKLNELSHSEKAATAFFEKIQTLGTTYNDSFANLSIKERQELAHLYQQFQSYVVAHDSNLDKDIVKFLNLNVQEKEQFEKGDISSVSGGIYRYYSKTKGAFNALRAKTEFNRVFAEKDKILTIMHRERATEQYRLTLIEDTILASERSAYAKQGNKTVLLEFTPPTVSDTVSKDSNQSAMSFHREVLAIENQLDEIDQAISAFAYFKIKLQGFGDTPLIQLNEKEKEELRHQYKKFQKYVFFLGKNNPDISQLDNQIVLALSSEASDEDNVSQDALDASSLLAFKEPIESFLQQERTQALGQKLVLLGSEKAARAQPSSLIVLTPSKDTKNTLFAQIKEQKLSTKVGDFLHKQLIPYLSKNISPLILHELELPHIKLPYKNVHLSAGHLALYKNLLNAFYYLQQGLVEFEKKADQKELDSTFSRVLFLKHLGMKVGAPIYQTVIAINALKGNPHLTEVLEQGLNLTEPLKKIPFLKTYFDATKGSKKPSPFSLKSRMNEFNNGLAKLQIDLINLVQVTSIQKLPEQYEKLKKDFLAEWKDRFTTIEYLCDLDDDSLSTRLKEILDDSGNAVAEQREKLDTLFGGNDPNWSEISLIYSELEKESEKIQGDELISTSKEKIQTLYLQLLPHLTRLGIADFPDDFIDKVKNTAELQQAIGKLFETEKYFDYSGAFGELQDIFYFEFDKNYGDLELQRKIKINYLLIQPYLQMLDSSYTSEFFSKLNTHSEFESALKKIVLHDRKKITDFISNQKLTNCYSILLSTTHKLQRFSNDSNAKVSKYIAEQKESNAADKLPKEGEKSARKPEKGKLIRRLVTELYDLEKKLTDMRVTKSVNPLNSAFEIFEEHGAPIQEPMNWHEEIEGIVSSITELDFKSAKIAKLLDSFKKLNAILNNIGVEGHELFVERLKEIRSNFNIALVIEADETEVNLCLRAGTLSEPVRQKFDKFYGKIVREILKDEILVADCLADATLTEKRIENEQKRLSKLQTKSTRKDLVEKIAGGENLFFVEINSIYYGIEDIDLWGNPKDIDVLKAKYQALIPYIEREIITVESIAVINSKKDFRDVLEKIQNRIQVNRNNLIKTHPSREAPLDHLSSAVSILLQQVNEGNLESELNPELKERLIDLLNSNAMLSTVFTNKLSLPKVNWSSFVSIDEARNSLSMFEDILTSKDEYSPTSEIDHIYYGIRFLDVNNEKQVRILKEKYNRLLPYINKENITVELVSSTFDRASLASHLDKIQRRIITKYHELSKDNPQKAKSLSTLYEEISALHTELDDDQNFVDLRKIKLIELVEKYSVLVPEIFSSEIVIPNNQLDSKQEIISFKMKLIQIGKLFSKGRVGVFEKLQSLEEGLETNANLFEDKFARQLLLECYRDVVPQLILITKQQSLYYDIYLKKLESIGSKDDFLNAFNTLISHKAALNEQILIASKTDEISIALTHSRIRGFEERLIDEQKQLKEIKFQKCLKLDVVSVFNEYLGFYSPVFHQHIIPIFTEQKDKILGRITSADYIEEKLMEQIAMEIDENRPPMQKYKSLTPILEDNALQHLREVYKKLHFCNEFAVKVKLPKQKALLTKELREKNPVAQQKLDFMNAHEQNLISEIENKSIEEIREYMHTFHRKLKAYDDLMVVFSLIDKLDNGIRKQVAPLLPPVYVNPAYYEELLTLRARLDAPDYQYAKEDADIFENYYKAMQPILEKRNSRYTIDYFQIDNLEGLKKGVAELTPDLSPESKEFLTQIDTVTTIKGIITRKETGIAERKIATQYFFSQYVEPAFSLASVAAWIKDLIMEIKNFFAGNESYFNVKEINYFFKDRIRDIKPKLDPQDEEGEHIAQRNN